MIGLSSSKLEGSLYICFLKIRVVAENVFLRNFGREEI